MKTWTETFEGTPVQIRQGYMDGTVLCQANGKEFSEWWNNQRTRQYVAEVSADTGIPVSELAHVNRQIAGRPAHSFVHPLLWPSLGQWCSRKCELWVAKLLVTRYMADFTHAAFGEPLALEDDEQLVLDDPVLEHLASLDARAVQINTRIVENRQHDRPAFFRIQQYLLGLEERDKRIEERLEKIEKGQAKLLEAFTKFVKAVEQIATDMYGNVWKGVQWLVSAMHRVRPGKQRPLTPGMQKGLDQQRVERLLKDLRDQGELGR